MLVVVGRIGRPHGVKGAATIEVRTDEPDKRFAVGARLLTDSGLDLTVATATWHSGRLLVTFEGYEDRTAVEQLRNALVSVDRPADERPEDPEEFYDSDLEGCEVVVDGSDSDSDSDGVVIGVVREVSHLPGQDLLVVVTPDEREVLIPFVSAFVSQIDVSAKRIVITPPEGLLEPGDDD
ncbi:MAG: ribosome maturation factor RimM [Candidatus Nanopelagicales bacterium]|nr:ribosome maturation factor RimM [Candidatus Nanopelagicales bacterium]NKB91235.1 ribosome maturation factor RimM [Candidatus Nanopelagicales bacterium]